MKRSLSAPCLADEINTGSKKSREESNEPTGREYLQLALARVLELQRQVKDETYSTDHTSDLGESDSEEDVMKEVLIKVFKDLPGSSSAVTSIINRATRPQPVEVRAIRDKRIQLSGYDTCRRVALEFMGSVVKNTPINDNNNIEIFERGKFSMIEGKIANHKIGLKDKQGENRNVVGENSGNCDQGESVSYNQIFANEGISRIRKSQNINKESIQQRENANNIIRGMDNILLLRNGLNRNNFIQGIQNFNNRGLLKLEETDKTAPTVSREYEIRVRMLKGLDLHLANKQRDFTAKLMRQ